MNFTLRIIKITASVIFVNFNKIELINISTNTMDFSFAFHIYNFLFV